MDNRSKPLQLFGTPLSKSLDDEPQAGNSGPINRRRARLERQQIVQDEQGRRRFHGAFTGGFSAGYHGTVGTVQGFHPKSFSTQRGNKGRDFGQSSSLPFDHRPEDYMDDEDFDEFGIAPKKVRLAGHFSDNPYNSLGSGRTNARANKSSLVVAESIGERILRCMAGRKKAKDEVADQLIRQKTDFHGLGYKSLIKARTSACDNNRSVQNPLIASFNHGKRLKISGEAFGEGVLDEDDDNLCNTNEYGYDDVDNYEFPASKSVTTKKEDPIRLDESLNLSNNERHCLNGFAPANDVDTQKTCDNDCLKYQIPVIEDGWQMPARSEPIKNYRHESELNRQNLTLYHRQSDSFNEKFIHSTTKQTKCDDEIESRAGLVPYSDLKALEAKAKSSIESTRDLSIIGISINNRRVIEWRPCSLLCKHFEVNNPYPDNAYCGTKPGDLISSDTPTSKPSNNVDSCNERFAPMELRRSIFNINFDSTNSSSEKESDDSEDEPQVIECDLEVKLMNYENIDNCHHESAGYNSTIACCKQKESDQESDIVLVDVPKPAPEVIVLSSSSSVSACSTPKADGGDKDDDDDDDSDTYGPPLPPSREILQDLGRHGSKARQSTSQFSSKLPNKMPKKRKKSKNKKHKSS